MASNTCSRLLCRDRSLSGVGCSARSRSKTLTLLTLSTFLLTQLASAQSSDQSVLWEEVVYEGNVLNDKGYAYYSLAVTSYIFDGS
jgi:hypothetical protein